MRTSRFAALAVSRAREMWPGAEIRVLRQEGSGLGLAALVPSSQHIEMPRQPFTLAGILFSSWGRAASDWRPDEVVVQWWTPGGDAHRAVNRAALWLQPRGFHVVFEDGRLAWVSPGDELWNLLCNGAARLAGFAIIVGIAVGAVVLWPAAAWHRARARRALRGA